MTATVNEQATATVRGACPHDCSTVNAVNPFVFADLGNAPTFSDTRVEIEPARAGDT